MAHAKTHSILSWLVMPLAVVVAVLYLAGCEHYVHKIDIHQGTQLDDHKLAMLRPGMSRQAVHDLLGPPTLADPFHPNRWDYLYSLQPGRGERVEKGVTLFFSGERLQRIEPRSSPSK